jgi:hypothetical protein
MGNVEGVDQNRPEHGIVCFITVAGFLNGPGFERMRDYLRRKADEIWVIDCFARGSPARGQYKNLPGRSAARLHRALVTLSQGQ